MSKNLPRTSNRTLADLRSAANAALKDEEGAFSLKSGESFISGKPNKSAVEQEADSALPPNGEPDAPAVADEPGRARPLALETRQESSTHRPDKKAFRKSAAMLIVERHANISALAGLIPMPWVDLAAIAIVVDRMLRKVARLYGVRLDRERSKQLATAMLTGMAAPGIASFATTGLLRMTPGPHLLGIALTSVSAAVLVRVVGEVYISHLSSPEYTSDSSNFAPEPAEA